MYYLEPEPSIYKGLFELDDLESLHENWLFHQRSILNWLFLEFQVYNYFIRSSFLKNTLTRDVCGKLNSWAVNPLGFCTTFCRYIPVNSLTAKSWRWPFEDVFPIENGDFPASHVDLKYIFKGS